MLKNVSPFMCQKNSMVGLLYQRKHAGELHAGRRIGKLSYLVSYL